MTALKTAAVSEPIDLRQALEAKPPIRTGAPPCDDAPVNPAERLPAANPIRLNTMPHPASGPGGPPLTSRRH